MFSVSTAEDESISLYIIGKTPTIFNEEKQKRIDQSGISNVSLTIIKLVHIYKLFLYVSINLARFHDKMEILNMEVS